MKHLVRKWRRAKRVGSPAVTEPLCLNGGMSSGFVNDICRWSRVVMWRRRLLLWCGCMAQHCGVVLGITCMTTTCNSMTMNAVILCIVMVGTVTVDTVMVGTVMMGSATVGTVMVGTVTVGTVMVGSATVGTVAVGVVMVWFCYGIRLST